MPLSNKENCQHLKYMSLLNVTVLPGKSAPLRARQWFMIVLDLQSQCSHKIKIMQKVLKIFHLFIVRQ